MKKFLVTIALLACSLAAQAGPVFVVKIVNFSCPYCRASESVDDKIRDAAYDSGGDFLYGPITLMKEGSDARDRVYFASVKLDLPETARIRRALYQGVQDEGQMFENIPQVIVYLQRVLPEVNVDWNALSLKAISKEITASLQRTKELAVKGSVDQLPAYLLIQEGEVVAILDSSSSDTPRFPQLKDAVISKIKSLAKKGE